MAHGETDDFGNAVANDWTDIHDIHATILHQLGIDHKELTYRHGGQDQRLTADFGRVLEKILA